MSEPELTPDEAVAAEFALGLLDGEELLLARARAAREPDFAARVEWWEAKLAPLLDDLGGAVAGPELWGRIEGAAEANGTDGAGEVVVLRRQVRTWRAVAATAMAASVAALVFALLPLVRTPVAPVPAVVSSAPPLVASIPIAETPLRLAVTWLPERRELLVSAAGLIADGVHDHELWLIPDQGALRSLGVVKPGQAVRVALTPETAALIHAGSRMVLTREPLGGKPPRLEAGPVVAEGAFTTT